MSACHNLEVPFSGNTVLQVCFHLVKRQDYIIFMRGSRKFLVAMKMTHNKMIDFTHLDGFALQKKGHIQKHTITQVPSNHLCPY